MDDVVEYVQRAVDCEFTLAPGELLRDLHRAYLDARKNKRGKEYQLRFWTILFGHLAALPGSFSPDWLRFRPAHTLPFGK